MARVMIVTGGSRGIGAAVARLAGRLGYAVCVNYRERADRARDVVSSIVAGGGSAVAVQADVSIETDVGRLFAACDAALGPVTVLVNNAGVAGDSSPIADITSDNLRRILGVNIWSTILCAREAIRRMSPRNGGQGGAIVNISSIGARVGYLPGLVAYAASKGAIDTLTIGLAKEVGCLGIRVNAVRPGLIDTEMHEGRRESFQAIARTVPLLARAASADEVASAVLWLASDEASYVSGALVDVTGGR